MTGELWRKAEAAFRVWSFHIYYNKSFAEEPDLTFRFVKALLASCRPLRDRQAVLDWYEKRMQRHKQNADLETLSA
jgi:hypothetical protein